MNRYAQLCPIIYGNGSIQMVGEEVKRLGCKKVMLVSDETISKLDAYTNCKKSLIDNGIEVVPFNGIIPDPPDYIINQGGEIAKAEQIDGIVALGGGSVIDAAKGINVLVNNPLPVNQYLGNPVYNPGVPVVVIPTTAGTGSENTIMGVITDTVNNIKSAVLCPATLGVLDPEVTIDVPPSVTAYTGMDAFAHAAEAITTKFPNPKSDVLALEAIKKVTSYLPIAVADGKNIKAREELMLASNFAGMAFNDALVHLGHAIAHTVGAAFHQAHGTICALALPEVMKYSASVRADKVKLIGTAMGVDFTGNESFEEIGEMVANTIRTFIKGIGIPSVKELGIARDEFTNLASKVMDDVCYLYVPRELSQEEVADILEAIYENY
ncbi:iron-containing alcohol dehydrogenase [Bacillus massilinigeriensis]|uniref:iron-containing alcohol dehydrogenase n=1 Tax=Bacillus massilionigeriensis TaxID=1805475 RepID=UPI00096B35B0|nr:iron-containing alcohol dehydrogenase [Bacillus massilionigeriensis]